jgi:hypothetical protein
MRTAIMSKAQTPGLKWLLEHQPRRVNGWRLESTSWLHQLYLERMNRGRDLKVIITATDAQTGVGKSTLGFGLAATWHPIFAGEPWTAEEGATFDVSEFLDRYTDLPTGSVLMMEEAEQLDARRSMAGTNVDFSHYWMAMRVRQVVSILTLPSTTALDKRLWELSDVWINVKRRGSADVHECQINDYQQKLWNEPVETVEWPDLSDHPEMRAVDDLKQEKIGRELSDVKEEEETIDPKEAKRETKVEIAQELRSDEDLNLSGVEIGEFVGRSDAWVYNNTEAPDNDAN